VVYPMSADFPTLQLKAAKRDGRLSEALLDRRAKLKRSASRVIPFESSHLRSTPATVSADFSCILYLHKFT